MTNFGDTRLGERSIDLCNQQRRLDVERGAGLTDF
jgi:hypothetical protein